jgi:hypothetical protein
VKGVPLLPMREPTRYAVGWGALPPLNAGLAQAKGRSERWGVRVQACVAGLCWVRDTAVRVSLWTRSRLRAALLAAGAMAAGVAHFARQRLAAVAGRLSAWGAGLAAMAGPVLQGLVAAAL